MNRLLAAAALVIALSSVVGACTDDCQRLADLTCEKAGDASDDCQKIRKQAASPTAEDKEMCTLALGVFADLSGK